MREILSVFGRLGFLGFGGPIATMGMMEEETCRKRQWLSAQEFAEIYAVVKMLPGPAATQMAIYLGYLKAGIPGGILAGVLFILPCFFVVLGYSIWYAQRGAVAMGSPVLYGFQLGALVVIGLSIDQLAKPYLRHLESWAIALLSAGVVLWQPRLEPLVIFGFGIAGAYLRGISRPRLWVPFAGILSGGAASQSALAALFWISLKSGAFVFGTGLAIIPLLEGEAVRHHHWLTHAEFMDGLAIGQVTPGPVVITATFIGYRVAGLLGAVVATVGIFLPGFINMLVIVPRVWTRLRKSPRVKAFTAWAVPAVIGGIVGTTARLGYFTVDSLGAGAVLLAALAAAIALRPPAWALIPACGAAAWIFNLT